MNPEFKLQRPLYLVYDESTPQGRKVVLITGSEVIANNMCGRWNVKGKYTVEMYTQTYPNVPVV